MSQMGKYCKAYPIAMFREFPQWTENATTRPQEHRQAASAADAAGEPADSGFLYLQENYHVTDGIFIDENVVYNNVTPEWVDFCKQTLQFEIPEYAQDDADAARAVAANNGNGHAAS